MPVIINGSTGISGTDGSAGTPAVQGTDTNTGMFFPAADTIAFAEGGVEVMRIDSAGNVGIGRTPTERLSVTSSVNSNDGIYYSNTNTGASAQAVLSVSTSGALGLQIGQNYTTKDCFIYVADNAALTFSTNTTSRAAITNTGLFQFNSGYGSVATAYGCRAWVNFNGTGTVAIRASGNVSSITDNGTGDYTINMTTTMPDTNYITVGSAIRSSFAIAQVVGPPDGGTYTTSAVRLTCHLGNGTLADSPLFAVAIFR